MSWEAVGAIAELLGAGGVIASLVYLATQIRSSTAATKSASGEAAARAFREILAPIYSNRDLTKLFADALADFDSLAGAERQQAALMFWQAWKAAESIHWHYSRGMLERDTWEGWAKVFTDYSNTPGFRSYWRLRGDTFSTEFQAWISEVSTDDDGLSLAAV